MTSYEHEQSKKDLSLLQNRYKNAVGYIDNLFNKVITTLKEKDLYKDSIIVFSADHAEEFYEKKSLFQSSNLNEYHISIPIFYKLNSKKDVRRKLASQIDIFPSILDDLNITNFDSFFDGRSIFKETFNNYILSVGQNGVFFPKEFLFINENSLKIHGILSIKDSLLFEVIDSDEEEDKVKNDLNKIFQSLEKDHLQDFN